MEQTLAYSLRPVQDEDETLLLEIYSSSRADEMALVPWNADQKNSFLQSQFFAQQKHYRTYFPKGQHNMIVVNGKSIGRLYIDRRDGEIRILDLTILPHARGHGIGTQIIQELMKEASGGNQSLSIFVESFNRSLSLFQHLGFVKTDESGASWLMEWHASL